MEMTMPKPIAFAAMLAISMPASAHVTVWPKESVQGAGEKYEIRVPNEKQGDTIRVEVRFPAGLKVTSFEQKPGWSTEPLRDGSGVIVGARWTGRLPPMQFTEFAVLAVNPPRGCELAWAALQLYADGTRVEWSDAAGSKTPAPRETLRPR
jgi:uncharacterized protein YcnI